jgi:hypothetical protein
MVSIVRARCLAPNIWQAQRVNNMKEEQKIIIVGAIHESPLRVRRND